MRRFLLILSLLLLSCRTLIPESLPPSQIPTTIRSSTATHQPAAPVATPSATAFSPTPTPNSTPSAPVAPVDEAYSVRYHPDDGLFVGDQVSMEVIAPQDENEAKRSVAIRIDGENFEQTLAASEFGGYGIGGRQQATFQWAWDTSDLVAGPYTLTYSIQPTGPTWTETVSLQPAEKVPPPQPQAQWAKAETDCCVVYYITGTDAERDLEKLLKLVDEQAQDVNRKLGIVPSDPILITFLPRVLGHGGFTSTEISVSYLDRNYAGSGVETVIHHEMVHWQDAILGGDLRPTLLVEGLAVYLTGGHFKPEPLLPRAAALLAPDDDCGLQTGFSSRGGSQERVPARACGLDWYLPLRALASDFYRSQHEIGYLEAGALVEYMVDAWGWQAFSAFYRDILPLENGSQADAMDAALQKHFDLSLEELESQYLAALRQQALTPALVEDVRLTIRYYDTIRRYQKVLDPSAYFLTAWLPDGEEMRSRGIVADFVRRPSAPENIAIETLLVGADKALRSGDFASAEKLLSSSNELLDVYELQDEGDLSSIVPWGSVSMR